MQRTGSWSFDDHTTSTWIPSKALGMPSPGQGPSMQPEPPPDESSIWDDDDVETRKLSHADISRTLDSATDMEMDWDEDDSTTQTYSPAHVPLPRSSRQAAHAQAERAGEIIQASPAAAPAKKKAPIRMRNGIPQLRKPAVAAAVHAQPPGAVARPQSGVRPATLAPAPRPRVKTDPPVLRAPVQAPAPVKRVLMLDPAAPRVISGAPAPVRPQAARRAPSAPPPTAARPAPQSDADQPWAQAWEEAQALARANQMAWNTRAVSELTPLEELSPEPEFYQPQSHILTQEQHFTPAPQSHLFTQPQNFGRPPAPQYQPIASRQAAVLPPMAAVQQLRAEAFAQARIAAQLELDGELDAAAKQPSTELRRLALRSVVPGIALFLAVLAGRVLLAGPAPAAAPAPIAPVVETVAPQVEAEPAPAAPVAAQPAPIVEQPVSKPQRGRARAHVEQPIAAPQDLQAATERAAPKPAKQDDSADVAPATPPTAAEPEAPKATARGTGLLRLNSRPWSQVSVDGKPMGNTPLMGVPLSAGTHQIELVNPSLGMTKKFEIEVAPDEVVTRVVTLDE